jgi:hypothetical protein
VFEDSGPERDEVGEWTKFRNEERHNLYFSAEIIKAIIKEDEMGGACSTHGTYEECTQKFSRKTGSKRRFGRRGRRWKNNIKMDLKGIGLVDVDWIHLAQDRLC